MRTMIAALSILLLADGRAAAQTADEVQLRIGPFLLAANGAETSAGGWRGTGPLVVGEPTVGVFSVRGCGYFTITVPPNTFEEDATVGWRVEITPIRIVDHAVTFRLRWVRALDRASSSVTPVGEDVEVTLKPGESRPLETVPVVQAGAKTLDGRPCTTKAVTLRVEADFPDMDRRLIGVEAWLVERLANGKEESQLQSLRGLPHRPIHFYFDGVPGGGGKRLDIFGTLLPDPGRGNMQLAVEAISGEAAAGQQGYQATRWFRSTVQLKPEEIVEVALPVEKSASAFATRAFAIRLRAKQIR